MKGSNLVVLLLGFTSSALSEFVALDFDILRGDLDKRDRNKDQPQLVQRGVKRDGLALMTLSNQKTFYVARLKIGSNEEEVRVDVDTGSSDLLVLDDNVNCNGSPFDNFYPTLILKRSYINCTTYGTFNPKNSKSYKDNHTGFYSYRDFYYSLGTWGTDAVTFGNVSIPDFMFAVVNETRATSGVLGLGLPGNEVSYLGVLGGTQYENFPLRLKSDGIINKAAFSLYLSDQDTGSILLGAVDKAKYSGNLTTVPIVNADPDLAVYGFKSSSLYAIMVQGMSLSYNGKNHTISNTPLPALLDTGRTISYFPLDVFRDLLNLVGVGLSYEGIYYTIPCSSSSNTTTFEINFSGTTVQIPISDLVMRSESNDICYFGVLKALDGQPITFGDNILRSLYLVFDLDGQELSVAQAKSSNDTDIQVISSTIPGAVSAILYSSTSFNLLETNTKHSSGVKVDSGFMFLFSLLAGILFP